MPHVQPGNARRKLAYNTTKPAINTPKKSSKRYQHLTPKTSRNSGLVQQQQQPQFIPIMLHTGFDSATKSNTDGKSEFLDDTQRLTTTTAVPHILPATIPIPPHAPSHPSIAQVPQDPVTQMYQPGTNHHRP